MTNRFAQSEMSQTRGIDDIITVMQQNRSRWYGHVLIKDEIGMIKMHGLSTRRCTTLRLAKENLE